jgi:hypothetical protein
MSQPLRRSQPSVTYPAKVYGTRFRGAMGATDSFDPAAFLLLFDVLSYHRFVST